MDGSLEPEAPRTAIHGPGAVESGTNGSGTEAEGRVLVLAPGGRNADLLCRALREAGLPCQDCPDMDAVAEETAAGAGVVLLTGRTLTPAATRRLQGVLDRQPHWSDLPLVVLVEAGGLVGGGGSAAADGLLESASGTLLEEPVRPFTLVSTVRAALRARGRQYEVRDLHARLEDRVAERTLQVRQLAARLVVAEQDERERIAHVLHDDLQQQLFGASMLLTLMRRTPDPDRADVLADKVARMLDEAVQTARGLATELSPAILQSVRLQDVLEWVASEMQDKHGLAVEVEVRGDPALADPALRVILYQSVREALFNAVKHAGPAQARLVAWEGAGEAVVRVEDDGAGFDVTAMAGRPGGFGLSSVRERLGLVGGRFEVDSAPGQGTRVTLSVPCAGLVPVVP